MAHIYGKAGCTAYLVAGLEDPVNGKRLQTLEDIEYFHTYYREILAGTRATASWREDVKIRAFSRDEKRLGAELSRGIAWQTLAVDNAIRDLDRRRRTAPGLLSRARFLVQYWLAVARRDAHIRRPYAGIPVELERLRAEKAQILKNKDAAIEKACRPVLAAWHFLEKHESVLTGARGEEYVLATLGRLPDDYYVINDVRLRFKKDVYWKKHNEYIRTSQIDHIVAGPTGIFLLETKNWKGFEGTEFSGDVVHQVHKNSRALWYHTKDFYRQKKDRPHFASIIVALAGPQSGRHVDRYTDVVSPSQVCSYIRNHRHVLSEDAVREFVRIFVQV